VGPMLPDAYLIAVLSDSEHESVGVPNADTTINRGDHVTLLGQREAVREGMSMLTATHD
jgi:Trk K+ transport system NAD-binding subunit